MRILGIDPGLATMGWGVIETERGDSRYISCGIVSTAANMPFPERLLSIRTQLREILEEYAPDEIVFEELFFFRNVTTAFTVGAARGVAIAVCADFAPDNLYEYTPMQIKQAVVGYGHAEKQQVQQMVKMILHLNDIPRPDDAADAVATAITHANAGRARFQFKMK
ncbi:MAG: crossover junction endodeoxyribonuclease RuvC [Eubacteriales bacterium]|jgi:crossover junction endodeoxyribonuclease RuvC|nr:crossover junction endodeoxyribonuclease RuvC [Eubacteriales bacterium]NLO16288.1 crossover junction endodeoxyribonuclease RuvC [Clostridiales bacterium]